MNILHCIALYSQLAGIDPSITKAVIAVESNWNTQAVGSRGELGLMQVRPEHVPETSSQLLDACQNIRRGTLMLKAAMISCKHKVDNTWINCYNLGIAGGSRLRKPTEWKYYRKVMAQMEVQ